MENLDVAASAAEAEIDLEHECVDAGINRYRQTVAKHAHLGTEGQTNYGMKLVRQAVEKLDEAIKGFLIRAQHSPGPRHAMKKYLDLLKTDVAAFITARVIYDQLHYQRTIQGVAFAIGSRIEDEIRFSRLKKSDAERFETIKKNLDKSHYSFDPTRRRKVLAHCVNKYGVDHQPWTTKDKGTVGLTLFELFFDHVGTVQKNARSEGNKTIIYIEPTRELHEWITGQQSYSEVLRPLHRPMICPPVPWTSPDSGGYLIDRLKYPLVKPRMGKMPPVQMPQVYTALNALQETRWKINTAMLAKVMEVWDTKIEVEGMSRREDEPLPPKPVDFDTNEEARRAWKLMAKQVYIANQKAKSQRRQARRTIFVAEEFANRPVIHFPMQLDFRGRIYAKPEYLQPQGSDLAKSLLTFAEGKRLGADGVRWLAIHLANTHGEDSCSLNERAAWTFEHSEQIKSTANDPIEHRFWTGAEKPFQFLAAAIEWAGYLREGEDYVCSLPIMVDGSCNGLQHFSAMSRDEECGRQVNLIPQERPADIYETVAKRFEAILRKISHGSGLIAEWAKNWLSLDIDRKLCKQPVMVLPYGGTNEAFFDHLLTGAYERMMKQGKTDLFGKDFAHAVVFARDILNEVMNEVIVGPRKVMAWLQEVVGAVNELEQPVCWTTPSGFYVQQKYPERKEDTVRTTVGEKLRRMQIRKDMPKLDKRTQVQSITANFVHSMDAAALTLTLNAAKAEGLTSLAAVHDSYGTLAADMPVLLNTLRNAFVEMYEKSDVLNQFRREVSDALHAARPTEAYVELSPPPSKGKLDLRKVLESDFFFA